MEEKKGSKSQKSHFYLKWPWNVLVYILLVIVLRIFAIPVILLIMRWNKKTAARWPSRRLLSPAYKRKADPAVVGCHHFAGSGSRQNQQLTDFKSPKALKAAFEFLQERVPAAVFGIYDSQE